MNENIFLSCPHCNLFVHIEQINCGIFRHGVFKINGTQINPHASKESCDFYVKNDLILGCGKPFKIIQNQDDTFIAVICDYI